MFKDLDLEQARSRYSPSAASMDSQKKLKDQGTHQSTRNADFATH